MPLSWTSAALLCFVSSVAALCVGFVLGRESAPLTPPPPPPPRVLHRFLPMLDDVEDEPAEGKTLGLSPDQEGAGSRNDSRQPASGKNGSRP
jgi:hypothetical protein